MRWSIFEDTQCSIIFIVNYVYKSKKFKKISESIQEAVQAGVDKSEGSIKMKFSNIAALCDEYGLNVQIKIGRLTNYSRQNIIAFEDAIKIVNKR
jgi:hypothetical protein